MKRFDPEKPIELSEAYSAEDLLAAGLMNYCSGFGQTPVVMQDENGNEEDRATAEDLVKFFNDHQGERKLPQVDPELMTEFQELGMLEYLSFDELIVIARKIAGGILRESIENAEEVEEEQAA